MTFPLDQIPPGRSRTLGTSFAPDNATAHRLAGFVAEPDGAKRILVVTSSRENAYMDYSRQPPSAAKGIDMSWPDWRVADELAARVERDRKRVVLGQSVVVSVGLGGRRLIQKKNCST